MQIRINPEKLAGLLARVVLALLALSTVGYVFRFYVVGRNTGLIQAFSLGRERNLPTYFSSMALLFCSLLLLIVAVSFAQRREKYTIHWYVLSAIFFYLSLDELLEIHERLIHPFRMLLHTRGVLRFAWVIPYGFLLVIFVLSYLRFLWRLPKKSRTLFVVAGFVYVFGAMGMELIGSAFYDSHSVVTFSYVMLQTLEEVLEMTGVVIFIYALTAYIRDQIKTLTIELE